MRLRPTRLACLAVVLLAAPACNAIFGINGGQPESAGGSGGSMGHGGATVTSSTGTGGHGGTSVTSSTGTGTGGQGGAGVTTSTGTSTGGQGGAGVTTSTGTGGGSTCTPLTASCAGSMLTICDAGGKPGKATDCGAAALCDPVGQVCESPRTIALGAARGCAVDGQDVYCWGYNGGSPSGFGSLFVDDSSLMFPTPQKVMGVTAPVQVAVADVHQCALLADGSITCWGNNQFAVLGTTASVQTHTMKVDNEVAVEIGVAPGCSCARLGDTAGSVWCWGLQDSGCFGDGTNGGDQNTSATPVHVPLDAPATQIRIGDGGRTPSCALLATKEVWCWGAGYKPTQVPGVEDAEEVAVGWGYVFIRSGGGVSVSWAVSPPSPGSGGEGAGGGAVDGGSDSGASDAGAPGWTFATPVQYLAAGVATHIAAGNTFCAVEGNALGCLNLWQFNGSPATWDQPSSVSVPGTPTELTIGFGEEYGFNAHCLRIANAPSYGKSVYCWGLDDTGGLGVGAPEFPNTAQSVTLPSAATTLTCGGSSTNVTLADLSAHYWGGGGAYLPNGPQQITPSPPLTNLAKNNALLRQRDEWEALFDVKSGGATPLLLEGGSSAPGMRLLAWSSTNYADAFPGLLNNHLDMGRLATGQVIVYADPANDPNGNDVGLFGDGTTTTPATPTLKPVPLPAAATALAVYAVDWGTAPAHACAILSTGDLYCWGSNGSGESGVNGLPLVNVLTPTQVTLPNVTKPIVSVATGNAFACATDGLAGTGQVYCWGLNDQGQLGNGGFSQNPNALPAAVQGINNGGATVPALGVAAGDQYACAWLNDGTVMCWGCNDFGQLGSGDYETEPMAVPVVGLTKTVKSVSAYQDHTCALYTDGSVACWGDSYSGQVGNGTSATYTSPTMVQGLP